MRIRYIHGMRTSGVYCVKCGARRDGRVFRERYRWIVKMDCGHRAERGYVLPPEELERRGYVNYKTSTDPRHLMRIEEEKYKARKQQEEAERRSFVRENLTRGKMYL